MDLVKTVRAYVNKMLIGTEDQGMKVLIMDSETVGMISLIFLQSDLVNKQVFLFDLIDKNNQSVEKLCYLCCVCFVRPTESNTAKLCEELSNPRYGSYFLYFSNIADRDLIRRIAEADRYELVSCVQEYYVDYYALDRHLFSVETSVCCRGDFKWDEDCLLRCIQSLTALMLSTKRYPVIRYQGSSKLCKDLAEKIALKMAREASSFNFNCRETSVLLIIDRREDSVSPMLNQWTYQAMLHEIIGLKRNRIDLADFLSLAPSPDEPTEIILNSEQDEFYAKNRYQNYGEIGVNIKSLLEVFQEKHKTQSKLETIADMKNFVETYPEFRRLSNTVTKHIKLISELSKQISTFRLMEISELEQKIVCANEHNEVFEGVKRMLVSEDEVRDADAVRLVALYMLRYEHERQGEIAVLRKILERRRINSRWTKFLDLICAYGGNKFRKADIFDSQSTLSFSRHLIKGLMGVENVYSQHRPLVQDLVHQMMKSRLKDAIYPYITGHSYAIADQRINDVIVFIVGGVTYEEANCVHDINESQPSNRQPNEPQTNVVIGGTHVHNFRSFVDEVIAAASKSVEIQR